MLRIVVESKTRSTIIVVLLVSVLELFQEVNKGSELFLIKQYPVHAVNDYHVSDCYWC